MDRNVFTLIEPLAVVFIIVTLASVSILSNSVYTLNEKISSAKQNQKLNVKIYK